MRATSNRQRAGGGMTFLAGFLLGIVVTVAGGAIWLETRNSNLKDALPSEVISQPFEATGGPSLTGEEMERLRRLRVKRADLLQEIATLKKKMSEPFQLPELRDLEGRTQSESRMAHLRQELADTEAEIARLEAQQ